jgi:hypothetical protein
MKRSSAANGVSLVARPGLPFIALDTLISTGFDSLPWARVRFLNSKPERTQFLFKTYGKILYLTYYSDESKKDLTRSENQQWGGICPNATGFEWSSL